MEVYPHRYLAYTQQAEGQLSETNGQKLLELHSVINALLLKMLVRGFHGEVAVKFTVQDGTIRQIEERIGRKHR